MYEFVSWYQIYITFVHVALEFQSDMHKGYINLVLFCSVPIVICVYIISGCVDHLRLWCLYEAHFLWWRWGSNLAECWAIAELALHCKGHGIPQGDYVKPGIILGGQWAYYSPAWIRINAHPFKVGWDILSHKLNIYDIQVVTGNR